MITATDLTSEFGRNLDIVKAQTQGLTHADSLLQLPFRGNCMNWVLGHMADSRNNLLKFLQHEPILNEAELQRYGYDSQPVRGDGEDILSLEQLLAHLEQSQEAIATRLQMLSPDELAQEVDSFLGKTSLGQLVFFLYFHDTYHTGQLEALRQLAGKDDKVI
jgi:uncharacterized damage-inducible protein DinB